MGALGSECLIVDKRLCSKILSQALQDHNIRHVKFLDALEAEKRKMAQDLERMQQEKRWKTQNITPCTSMLHF